MTEQNATTTQWPTYALRVWMTALLGQMERARDELDNRIELQEKELARLRAQKERSVTVIASLRESVGAVDNVLRSARDTDKQSKGLWLRNARPGSRNNRRKSSRRLARNCGISMNR